MSRAIRWWAGAVVLVGIVAASQRADADWLDVRREDGGAVARWKLEGLTVRRCDAAVFDARLGSVPVGVVVTATTARLLERRLDFARDRIDGRRTFGHDGLGSRAYVAKNLANRPYLSRLRIVFGGSGYTVPSRAYPFLLDPALGITRAPGCLAKAFWAPEERTLVLQLYGGFGAGTYRTILLFAKNGLSAVYAVHCPEAPPDAMCSLGRDLFHRGAGRSKRVYRMELVEERE